MRIWWWSVSNRSAMMSEYLNSSPSTPPTDSKPIENVARPCLAGLGEQPDDQAGVDAAGQQAADGHVGDQAALDGHPQRVENRVLPITFGPVGPVRRAGEVRLPVRGGRACGRRARSRRSDAGGTLVTPRRIVRGGGTTEWKDR